MCIQAYALCLVGVKNIQVYFIKIGMWKQNVQTQSSFLVALDISATGDASGIANASTSRVASFVEQSSYSIFVDDDEDEDHYD